MMERGICDACRALPCPALPCPACLPDLKEFILIQFLVVVFSPYLVERAMMI